MTTKSAIEIMRDAAILENQAEKKFRRSSKAKFGGEETSENIPSKPFFVNKIVSLKDEPVSLETFTNFDPSIRQTGGFYQIIYNPTTSIFHVKNKPFFIGQDLIKMKVSVSGVRHWKCLCQRIPELAWIERNSTLTDQMFANAKKHPGMPLYFSVDWDRYIAMIEQKAEEQGIDIDHKALVVYSASRARAKEINESHKLAPTRTKKDVADILNEVDKEMLEYGETTTNND